MPKFRKKPVEIEAFRFVIPLADSPEEMPMWLHAAFREGKIHFQGGDEPYLTIKTLEGDHRASVGDWIIRGVKGELYPCKPDIFAQTYDPVSAPSS